METADKAFLDFILEIHKEIHIAAPAAVVFESVLEQMGPHAEFPDGKTMNMVLEPFPGGRWYRDLGKGTGHLWGHVQVIKPPTLIEITGPMMMSYPVINHFQYRLAAEGDGTKLTLIHRGFGTISPEHRKGLDFGWDFIVKRIHAIAMAKV